MSEQSEKVKLEEPYPLKKPQNEGSKLNKKCIVCGTEEVTNPAKDWYKGPTCNHCYKKHRYRKNPKPDIERRRQRYLANHEEEKRKNRTRAKTQVDKNKERRRVYYLSHREESLKRNREYRMTHKEEAREYAKQRRKTDVNFRLAGNLRNRFRLALHRQSTTGSAIKDLGCSIAELKIWIESLFKPDMTWDNYGKWDASARRWNIDHIVPLSRFDLTDPEQVKIACHYTNLQPLWVEDNIAKYNH